MEISKFSNVIIIKYEYVRRCVCYPIIKIRAILGFPKGFEYPPGYIDNNKFYIQSIDDETLKVHGEYDNQWYNLKVGYEYPELEYIDITNYIHAAVNRLHEMKGLKVDCSSEMSTFIIY